MLPIIYSLALFATGRSIMIHLVDEKAKRYKETQKVSILSVIFRLWE
jgi:hypothetical protein